MTRLGLVIGTFLIVSECALALEEEGGAGDPGNDTVLSTKYGPDPYVQDDETGLLQTSLRASSPIIEATHVASMPVQGDSMSLAPVGRTFLSTSPTKSAAFFTTYFDASVVPLAPCQGVEQVGVDINIGLGSHVRYIFMKSHNPTTLVNFENLVAKVEASIKDVFEGRSEWSSWIDNHDGFLFDPMLFKSKRAMLDGVLMALTSFPTPPGSVSGDILRIYIPHTLWTLEWRSVTDVPESMPLQPTQTLATALHNCRVSTIDPSQEWTSTAWQKVTFMTANLTSAADFALMVLGAEEVTSDYPLWNGADCVKARWFILPDVPIAFHFVYWPGNQSQQNVMGSRKFAAIAEHLRDSSSGIFDEFMYNSLVLNVSSLDPYLTRLKRHSLPHFLERGGAGQTVLFANVPHTAITVQLHSTHINSKVTTFEQPPAGAAKSTYHHTSQLSAVSSRAAAVCAQQFGR